MTIFLFPDSRPAYLGRCKPDEDGQRDIGSCLAFQRFPHQKMSALLRGPIVRAPRNGLDRRRSSETLEVPAVCGCKVFVILDLPQALS